MNHEYIFDLMMNYDVFWIILSWTHFPQKHIKVNVWDLDWFIKQIYEEIKFMLIKLLSYVTNHAYIGEFDPCPWKAKYDEFMCDCDAYGYVLCFQEE